MCYNAGMATVINEYTREDGHVIAVYESGAEYDKTTGRLVKAPPKYAITAENASEFKRRRQEKAQEALRARILEVTKKHSDAPLGDSAEAVAEAGAFLWDEIVLGQDVYPRDRLDAWERIGRHSGILADKADRDTATPAEAVTDILREVASLAAALAHGFDNSNYHNQAIDGAVTDEGQGAESTGGGDGVGGVG